VSGALGQLRAAFAAHKAPILVLAAGVVVVAGLAARRNKTLSSVSTSTTSTTATDAAAPARYDSTGTDVYNGFEGLLQQVDALAAQIPVPGATTGTTAPTVQGYYRRTGTQAIYEALSDGTLKWLDTAAFGAAGHPAWQDVAASDPMWNRPVTGTDAPADTR
jgi:hypothetical protein